MARAAAPPGGGAPGPASRVPVPVSPGAGGSAGPPPVTGASRPSAGAGSAALGTSRYRFRHATPISATNRPVLTSKTTPKLVEHQRCETADLGHCTEHPGHGDQGHGGERQLRETAHSRSPRRPVEAPESQQKPDQAADPHPGREHVQPLVGHVEQPDRRLGLGVAGLGVHEQGARGGRTQHGQPRARRAARREERGHPAHGHGSGLSQQRAPGRGAEQLGERHACRRPLRKDHGEDAGRRQDPSGRDHDPRSSRQAPPEDQHARGSSGGEQRQAPVQQPQAGHCGRSRGGARQLGTALRALRRSSPRRGLDSDAESEGAASDVPIHLRHRAPVDRVHTVGERRQRDP